MIYRREIDGLRAVAVVPVILFHAGMSVFSGGYVGVDVFFVISGYLITSILIAELEQGTFSIARFYERRARRILPALFLVMLCCMPFAWMWMLPSELRDFSQSIVAVVFFASNILFWRQEGYFEPAAELKPLLHTWSLAVEEQYYLVFPVFLLLAWRFGRNRVFWAVCAIAAISLLASEWGWRNRPSANFYLAPTRIWELLIGSMCAFWLTGRQQRPSNLLSLIGLAMIAFANVSFDETIPFPSVYALVPVVGTALIIVFCSADTWVGRLLSARAFVGIGLISYSAYLWHQPLFAFARIRSVFEPSSFLMAALALLSLILAYLSWRYVEKPFRTGKASILPTRGAVFAASTAAAAVFVAIGAAGHFNNGFGTRFSAQIAAFDKAKADRNASTCNFSELTYPAHPVNRCLTQYGETAPVYLLGDNHAMAVSAELKQLLNSEQISHYDMSYSGCLPLEGFKRFDRGADLKCAQFNRETLAFARAKNAKTLVLTSRFVLFHHGRRYNNGEGGIEAGDIDCVWVDVASRTESECDDPARRARVLAAYETRIRALAQSFNVVLVAPIPEAGWDVPGFGYKNAHFNGNTGPITTSYDRYKQRSRDITQVFDRLERELPNVHVARVDRAFCSNQTGRCKNADADGIYYYDNNHPSNAGARLAAPIILSAIRAANAEVR